MSRIAPNRLKSQLKMAAILNFSSIQWCYQIYNIPIGFSDLENVGLDTKFVFLCWPKVKIWAIQFSEDFDGGHFEKCQKRWGRPNLYGVNISIIDQWGPLNKMIPLMEDPGGGGGGARWPLWAHGLYTFQIDISSNSREIKYQNWPDTQIHRHRHTHIDRQGENNTSQLPRGRGN